MTAPDARPAGNAPRVSRREAREKAMQVLYAHEISREPVDGLLASIAAELADDPAQRAFAESLVYTALNHTGECDDLIRTHAENWDFERIATLDRIVLRLGICEFRYFADIPIKVTVNEYVEIAKRFSTGRSGRFVNGILDAILVRLRGEGLVEKRGRGLLDA